MVENPRDYAPSDADSNAVASEPTDQPPASPQFQPPPRPREDEGDDDRVFLVPYRWLRESLSQDQLGESGGNGGIPYTASRTPYVGAMKIINSLFNSDLVFDLRRHDGSPPPPPPPLSSSVQLSGSEDGASHARTYALIRTDLLSRALRWHRDTNLVQDISSSSHAEDDTADVYAVTLRISVVQESKTMTVKISKRDNEIECFKRASKIFSFDNELVHVWDFSEQTTLIFMNEINKLHRDGQQQADQEITLVLHIYALSESLTCQNKGKGDDAAIQFPRKVSSSGGFLLYNGSNKLAGSDCLLDNKSVLNGSSHYFECLGLTGLENLGNTCFMNSAIQCLAHTPKLVEYFHEDYQREINYINPLGMGGELALAFGELLRKLWAPERTPVIPKLFKTRLSHFAPQFSGYNQHDSQELLAFLLDGLHEDLNRVKHKPYIEVKDALDCSDEEVADEYWKNHLARNDSIIVDICQGQYRSRLVCPTCGKVSVTFDPFMYLSLPLPLTSMRTMTVTVFGSDGITKPSAYTITVPKYGKCKDLIQCLSNACSLRDDENLLVAEIYSNQIIRYLEEPSDSISLIRDGDQLAAYRLPKDLENFPLVVFMHKNLDEQHTQAKLTSHYNSKAFVPLVTRLSGTYNWSIISSLFLKLLKPFLRSSDASVDDCDYVGNGSIEGVDDMTTVSHLVGCEGITDTVAINESILNETKFYTIDVKCSKFDTEIPMDREISISKQQKQLHVLVCWSQKTREMYDTTFSKSLPVVHRSNPFFRKQPHNSVSLYACLDAFLKEEPLGPEDMWFCPSCKVHRQASKKLDLWRLPEVLVIHLKRFSYNRFMENKLETFVDFPIRDLELTAYISHDKKQSRHCYELFAISNHYGGMGGGHYTAHVLHEGKKQWYDFDDRNVSCIDETSIKTSAAYVLFYRRVQCDEMDEV